MLATVLIEVRILIIFYRVLVSRVGRVRVSGIALLDILGNLVRIERLVAILGAFGVLIRFHVR